MSYNKQIGPFVNVENDASLTRKKMEGYSVLQVGSVIDGKYRILKKVGQGGLSTVYLAMDENTNKAWAVKEIKKGPNLFYTLVQQLSAETGFLMRLNHPNIPRITKVIDTTDSFIIIMSFIKGCTLRAVIKEYGVQPEENIIAWAKQICNAIGYLHTRKPAIIFRDMKPDNIMIEPDGTIMLIDFGLALVCSDEKTADTSFLGTKGYAAPEQYGGMGRIDARTDIYGIGATLYYLVTGVNPSVYPNEMKSIREINPKLSIGLEKIILKCLHFSPNDRYQSVAELLYDLEHYNVVNASYRKSQKKKLILFLLPCIMGITFGTLSILLYSTGTQTNISSLVFAILSCVMLTLAVIVFFGQKIIVIIGELSGIAARKEIEKIWKAFESEKHEENSFAPLSNNYQYYNKESMKNEIKQSLLSEENRPEKKAVRKVFLSYSWDDNNHQEWVRQLARDLYEESNDCTINTILDVNDMVLGDQITHFMEQSIANSDYVVIICTPLYKKKADNRSGGVGYEDSIITGELYNKNNQRKYIPILARGSWTESIPTWAIGKLGVDMTTHEEYLKGIAKLKETIKQGKM